MIDREKLIRIAHETECLDEEHYGTAWVARLESLVEKSWPKFTESELIDVAKKIGWNVEHAATNEYLIRFAREILK